MTILLWPTVTHAQDAPFRAPPSTGPAFVDTSQPAIPGAEEVIGDVSSFAASVRFQKGSINGLVYSLFPDGSIRIRPDRPRTVDTIRLRCEAAVACVATRDGREVFVEPATRAGPPTLGAIPSDEALGRYLAKWVLQGTGPESLPVPTTDRPDPEAADTTQLTATTVTKSTPAQDIGVTRSTPVDVMVPSVPTAPVAAKTDPPPTGQRVRSVSNALNQNNQSTARDNNAASIESPTCVPSVRTSAVCQTNQPPLLAKAQPRPSAPSPGPARAPQERLSFSDRFKLDCSVTGSTSLEFYDAQSGTSQPGKPRVNLGCGFHVSEALTGRVSLTHYFNATDQQDWDPDFTYALYYKVNDKITLSYSSYSARFDDLNGGFWQELFNGSLTASYKLPRLELPHDRSIACTAGIGLPNPLVKSASLTCGYSVTSQFRIDGTAYFYLPEQQGDYAPDYSYSASYKLDDNWTIRYSNYSNNRWPWNKGETASAGFRAGSLSATYRVNF